MNQAFIYLLSLLLLSNGSGFSQVSPDLKEQEGRASYYAGHFHGRKTASGERFNNYDLTAAHKKLPFNTYLNVINKDNGKNVIVRVNDRGPYVKNRVVDLSQAAILRLKGFNKGVIPVRVKVLDLIHYSPELDSLFTKESVVTSMGEPCSLVDMSLSLWHTRDLVHAIYYANDIYIKEPFDQILIVTTRERGERFFHIVITGISSIVKLEEMKKHFYAEGFMKVDQFTFDQDLL